MYIATPKTRNSLSSETLAKQLSPHTCIYFEVFCANTIMIQQQTMLKDDKPIQVLKCGCIYIKRETSSVVKISWLVFFFCMQDLKYNFELEN